MAREEITSRQGQVSQVKSVLADVDAKLSEVNDRLNAAEESPEKETLQVSMEQTVPAKALFNC